MFWGRVVITPQKKENTGDDTFKGVLKFSLQTNQKEQHQATERVILMNSWVAVTQISPPLVYDFVIILGLIQKQGICNTIKF